MTLLCIGQSGQVAKALAEQTKARDRSCVCVGRPDADLRDAASLARTIERVRPKFVVNAAAYTAVDKAESDQGLAFAVNADGAGTLAKLCAAHDLPLIQLSTDYVFDGRANRPYSEDDIAAPINVYGASKLDGERAVQASNPKHIILRTSWIYSPFGTNFVKTMLRLAQKKGSASVVDDQIGSPTDAFAIADTILTIIEHLGASPNAPVFGTYHFASQGSCSWADVAAVIFETYRDRTGCKIALKRIPSSDYPTAAQRPLNSRLQTEKIERTFGIKPADWTHAVRDTVNRIMDEGL